MQATQNTRQQVLEAIKGFIKPPGNTTLPPWLSGTLDTLAGLTGDVAQDPFGGLSPSPAIVTNPQALPFRMLNQYIPAVAEALKRAPTKYEYVTMAQQLKAVREALQAIVPAARTGNLTAKRLQIAKREMENSSLLGRTDVRDYLNDAELGAPISLRRPVQIAWYPQLGHGRDQLSIGAHEALHALNVESSPVRGLLPLDKGDKVAKRLIENYSPEALMQLRMIYPNRAHRLLDMVANELVDKAGVLPSKFWTHYTSSPSHGGLFTLGPKLQRTSKSLAQYPETTILTQGVPPELKALYALPDFSP